MDALNSSPQLETHPYNTLNIPPDTTLLIVGTAPPQQFSFPRPPFSGPKRGWDADFFYGSGSNYLWSYLKRAANEADFAKPGSDEAKAEPTEHIMKKYLFDYDMWMHDVLQTYVHKPGKPTWSDARFNLEDSRTTFMDFAAVLAAGKTIERVVFTSVTTSDWFFGKATARHFPKEEAEAYRRIFLDANVRRKAKKDTDEQYTDEFCRAEFLGRTIRFHVLPSPSPAAGATLNPRTIGIYRKVLFEQK